MMGHSYRCHDLKTYWDRTVSKCMLCPLKPGHEITPNCGKDDEGGLHERAFKECKVNSTFNDGSSAYCKTCASCPPGYNISSPCSLTTDTQCQDPRSGTSGVTATVPTTSQHASTLFSLAPTTNQGSSFKSNATATPVLLKEQAVQWAVPVVILTSVMLVMISACLIYMKWKRGQHTALRYSRRLSYIKAGFSPLSAPPANSGLEDILSPNILSAPLQTVLDNLDVLEELVILLDPECNGVKNTKHLASHYSFPATWITYTYSLKDSKSPLKAVLEGVTSRNPDLTVGHLAKLLRHMERNDAIAVLAKLGPIVVQEV